ncbi:hypothetical protein, partial [Persicobacter diffluens]|uniref:hypothetical protein n=1 Tax=Persicobacter diffluens TaxID=981 RepID=UPI0030C665FF
MNTSKINKKILLIKALQRLSNLLLKPVYVLSMIISCISLVLLSVFPFLIPPAIGAAVVFLISYYFYENVKAKITKLSISAVLGEYHSSFPKLKFNDQIDLDEKVLQASGLFPFPELRGVQSLSNFHLSDSSSVSFSGFLVNKVVVEKASLGAILSDIGQGIGAGVLDGLDSSFNPGYYDDDITPETKEEKKARKKKNNKFGKKDITIFNGSLFMAKSKDWELFDLFAIPQTDKSYWHDQLLKNTPGAKVYSAPNNVNDRFLFYSSQPEQIKSINKTFFDQLLALQKRLD